MKNIAIRGAVAAAATGLVVSGLVAGAGSANADTRIPLKSDTVTQKVGDGTVTISIKNQSALLSPGMVALPTTRNAWVSGVVSAKINGTSDADGGSIKAGYMVGCQVDVGSAKVSLGSGASAGAEGDSTFGAPDPSDNGSNAALTSKVSGTTGGSISLKAGTIGTQYLTFDRKTWPKPGDTISPSWATPSTSFKFKGDSGSLAFSDQTIGVDGCAGYAQARFFAYVNATVGNTASTVVLWGQPFTLG